MNGRAWLVAAALAAAHWLCAANPAAALSGRVVDGATGAAIAGATVTFGDWVATTGIDGSFRIDGSGETLQVRAPGYLRSTTRAAGLSGAANKVPLQPFQPKALYLSFYGVGSSTIRDAALKLIRESRLNAVVIDVKGDRGGIPYPSAVPLAEQIGARKTTTVRDLAELIGSLRSEAIYTIARIVVFKDDPLAKARPELAVKRADGAGYRDREKLGWTDPFRRAVWDYNIDIAVEAARAGFDEIQFDYVRFPDAVGLRFAEPNTQPARIAAITGFLGEARRRLQPFNVFLAADVFGYVCWNRNDTQIGQRLEDLMAAVDYVSPMLYPSCFQFGIPKYRNPTRNPYEIVRLSLDQALQRTGVSPLRFRPWLQAFKDYAFDRRMFDADEVAAQIRAAEDFGSNGWMLWNPRNDYSDTGIK